MSLASLATRFCFVEALRGQTYAGDNVEDSPIDPIGLAQSAKTPIIVVYSDSERFKGDSDSVLSPAAEAGAHVLELTADLFLPSALSLTPPGGTPLDLNVRDFGAGIAFDLMIRQIQAVISSGQGTWAELFRRCVDTVQGFDVQAYVLLAADKNTRLPARSITMHLDILDSPEVGGGASSFWPDFVAAIQGSDDLSDFAPLFTAAINGDPLPTWRQTAAALGLSQDEMADIGLGPLGGVSTDDEVPMRQGKVLRRDDEAPVTVQQGIAATFE